MARSVRHRFAGAATVAEIRAHAPRAEQVSSAVAEILGRVRDGGQAELERCVAQYDGAGGPLRVSQDEIGAAVAALDPAVRAALELAIANVGAVARAGCAQDAEVLLEQGQRVVLREVPVARAGIYVPGGRAPYPSTVVMGAVTAQAAGVAEVVVCAPAAHQLILAASGLCGVSEVYRMGGAHAVAALAYGTDAIAPVDVIAGPGNLWVQEAKRLVSGVVGIDGFAGPSDVVVIAGADADPELVALDLLAQAEHGPGVIAAAVSDDAGLIEAVAGRLAAAAATEAVLALVSADDLDAALAFSELFAPEHLELLGERAAALAPRVRRAGCVFVGASGATAFGDYVAGSNHTLPTGGAARFASGLNVRHFTRRMAEVHIGPAAAALAGPGAVLARAEGFDLHAASMEVRENLRS